MIMPCGVCSVAIIVCGVLWVMWQNSSLMFFDNGIVCPGFSAIISFCRSIFSS